MMTHTRFVLFALLIAAVAVSCPAFAGMREVPLDPNKWAFDPDGICVYQRDATWDLGVDGEDVEYLYGVSPQGDPRIRQNIYNASQETWTDWHVELFNASNLRGIYVWDAVEKTPWVIELYDAPRVGFFAHVITSGPGNPMAIEPGETLYVEFTYDAIPGPVSITQYPTTWYPIPEPASIVALLAGIGALGFGSLRRIKR